MDFRSSKTAKKTTIILGILVFTLAFMAVAWRIDVVPDIFTDEIIYTRIGIRLAAEGALVWDSGQPFTVHPPLYFLAESLHFRLNSRATGWLRPQGDIFAAVSYARLLNAFFAGITALLLFLLGGRLSAGRRSWLAGLFFAGLFLLDPYGIRINRRAMLETLAGLLSLAGMAVLLVNNLRARPRLAPAIWAGLLLGGALLTKELAVISLLGLTAFGLWELRLSRPLSFRKIIQPSSPALHAFSAVLVALLTYSFYPLWVFTTGAWGDYYAEKILGIQRLLGIIQLTGWNRPGMSLAEFLARRLADYGSSYLLLALGGGALVWILLFGWRNRPGRLLAAWGLVFYPFFAFLALAGSGNDQFFYFLLIPAILLIAFALTMRVPQPAGNLPGVLRRWVGERSSLLIDAAVNGVPRFAALILLLALVLVFNLFTWLRKDAFGQDNRYHQLTDIVSQTLPLEEAINASGDPIKFHYFFPARVITAAATPEEAQELGVHFFVLAPRDIASRYGRIQPELAAWVQSAGYPLLHLESDSYGDIFLYYVRYVEEVPPLELKNSGAHWRSFQPPQTAFAGSLVMMLLVWVLALCGVTLGIQNRRLHLPFEMKIPPVREKLALRGRVLRPEPTEESPK